MKAAAKFLLIPLVILLVSQARGEVEWNEPEVVPEKLSRKNRKVLRFSGKTKPYSQIRLKKNKIVLYFDSGKTRKARIPKKHRDQFPVVADTNGYFAFDLYLPTVAVEMPIEIKSGKNWRTYNLNFRVPDAGKASEFEAIEESYRDREEDDGLRIGDSKKKYKASDIQGWVGLGLSYFDTSVESASINKSRAGSTLALPNFRLGLDWTMNETVRWKVAVRSVSGSTDDIGDSTTTGRDFSWFEGEVSAVWFSDLLSSSQRRLGFDFGLQQQSIPFFRERPTFINEAYFDNAMYGMHFGLFYEKTDNQVWNYEMYARYFFPFTMGDAFDLDGFPLTFQFGGGVKRPITKDLALGVFAHMNMFSMDVKYTNQTTEIPTDLYLLLLAVDARLIVNF